LGDFFGSRSFAFAAGRLAAGFFLFVDMVGVGLRNTDPSWIRTSRGQMLLLSGARKADSRRCVVSPPPRRMPRASPALRNYERHPYPGPDPLRLARHHSLVPPLSWINALGRPGGPPLRRILVAGCGTGPEAFALARQCPGAEIVGVDFSPRAIALARRAGARNRRAARVRFVTGDLTAADLRHRVGADFDCITCHGVLTYVPDPARALRALRGCLASDGVIYLGVNGSAHVSTRLRPWLGRLGFDATGLGGRERVLRRLLACWDQLQPAAAPSLAGQLAGYLASDVCGAHFNNWPLAHWRAAARRAGLEFAASVQLPHTLRRLVGAPGTGDLFDRNLGEMADLLDQADPASFHRLLLRPGREEDFDLAAGGASAARVCWTGLYALRLGRRDSAAGQRTVALDAPIFRLALRWPVSAHQAVALRELARAGSAGPAWRRICGRGVAADRRLRFWQGLAIVAPGR
jgi:SAM-dependent methyltransferase